MTLAQRWLEEAPKKGKYDFWIESRLHTITPEELPKDKRHLVRDLDVSARRVVFETDLSMLLIELSENKQIEFSQVSRTIRMPVPCVWVEWRWQSMDAKKPGYLNIGMLFEEDQTTGRVAWALICADKDKDSTIPSTLAVGSIDKLPLMEQAVNIGWVSSTWGKRGQHALSDLVRDGLFGLFLLGQPKTIRIQEVTHKRSFQLARIAKKKPPLLEYQRVDILIGKTATRYKSGGGGHQGSSNQAVTKTGKKRYHEVWPYFRTYKRGTPEEYVVWIDNFWRGDPKLGIIIKEHHVKRERTEK